MDTPTTPLSMDEVLNKNLGPNFIGDNTKQSVLQAMTEWEQLTSAPLLKRIEELDTQLKEVSKALNEMTGDWLAKGKRISELEKENTYNMKVSYETSKANAKLIAEIESLKKERDELKAWKESAMKIMSPMQPIGHAMNVGLGESIHDKILPYIESLKAENERLKVLIKKAWFGNGMDCECETCTEHFNKFKTENNL